MLLDFQVIREDVINCNSVEPLVGFNFIGGEHKTLAIQLLNGYNNTPYMLPAGYDVVLIIKTADSLNPLTKIGTVNATNRAIVTFDLSIADTTNAISGLLKLILTETLVPANKIIAIKKNIFVKVKSDEEAC